MSENTSLGQSETSLPKRREPTHAIRIEIPLHLDERPPTHDFDPIRDAVLLALNISRAAYVKAICDDAQVSLIDWPTHSEALHDEADELRRAALWVIDNWDSGATQHMSMKALRKAVGRGDEEGRPS
jgi:hypothetical protein